MAAAKKAAKSKPRKTGTGKAKKMDVIDAAFSLTGEKPWSEITLNDIAAKAGLDLAALSQQITGKTDIVVKFSRRLDAELLANLKKDPVEGEAHDRLFDALMRRFELMQPHKAALRNIARADSLSAANFSAFAASLMHSQRWLLAAIGEENDGRGSHLRQAGLACVYLKSLRVWLNDDDPGLARTMACLDKSLRDGANWLNRAHSAGSLFEAARGLARGFWRQRRAHKQGDAGS